METKKIHLKTNNFSVFYGNFQAVKDVSLKIKRREVTAIIGPSGCGKSTLLRAMNRMNDLIPDCTAEGEMIFDETNIYNKKVDVVKLRKKIGMVFQKPNVFPKSIFDNVAYGPRIHGIKRSELSDIVEKSLKQAAIWDEVKDCLKKNALAMSGGQQQRVCLARALAVKPEILLMDEPTSALDPKSTAKIEDLISELEKNYTIIIVTHNMQQAARISKFTAFMYEGDLIEFGGTQKIFNKPDKQATEDYITGRFG
ncbi:MAG: phosphate ABC transporter ATP-binding protein PstB [Verrucomicrobiota bacterium]|nr:phosphate ABC transporter ATP-binding protein PstB [Verrucomicrobiota bacterium]